MGMLIFYSRNGLFCFFLTMGILYHIFLINNAIFAISSNSTIYDIMKLVLFVVGAIFSLYVLMKLIRPVVRKGIKGVGDK